ncbi:MAG: Plug domain-containing protein [Deltaproteobacteria bacterium]|nr:Plug domain-containing protein [Deltaproteobacteria bacterium]
MGRRIAARRHARRGKILPDPNRRNALSHGGQGRARDHAGGGDPHDRGRADQRDPRHAGDGLKAIQNFPGVSRAPFGAGQLAIRGAAPGDSGVYLGYHEIPTLFHFGGLTSVFNSDILAQIDFVPGNFDSRYGDAIGGIVNVQPRKGRRDGYHGYVDADLFDAGALVEGPVGKGSFVLSARRSYVDAILPVVIPEEVGLGLTLAPRYWDYQALFDYPVGGGELSIRSFGSDDRSKLLFAEENDVDPDETDGFETTQWFHRVDVVYRKVDGPWEFLITPSYKRELFSGSFFGGIRFIVESDTFSGRTELSRRLAATRACGSAPRSSASGIAARPRCRRSDRAGRRGPRAIHRFVRRPIPESCRGSTRR